MSYEASAPGAASAAGARDGTGAADLPRWWIPVAVGVLAVVVGILALAWPGPTLLLVGISFGINLIVAGAGNLVTALVDDALSTPLRALEAVLGSLTLLAGTILLVRPGASVVVVALVLGFWFVFVGCLQLARSVVADRRRPFHLVFGLLGIIAGTLVLAQPGIGVATLVWIVGIAFLVQGALAIALGLFLRLLEPRGGEVGRAPGAAASGGVA